MAKFIVGARSGGIYQALHSVGVFADDPSDIARVIIDLQAGSAARVYIEKFADDALIDVIMSGGVEIVSANDARNGDV